MKYTYTSTFTPKENGNGYYCRVPDLPGCITSGRSLEDAIDQIADAVSIWLVANEDEGLPIPPATPQDLLPHEDGMIFSVIRVDTLAYRAQIDTRAVRKNVSLPAWLANLADKRGINCSQVLQEGLLAKLGA